MNDKRVREYIMYVVASISFLAGYALLFISFNTPPPGEIDHSVMVIFGEIQIFVASILGISIHYRGIR